MAEARAGEDCDNVSVVAMAWSEEAGGGEADWISTVSMDPPSCKTDGRAVRNIQAASGARSVSRRRRHRARDRRDPERDQEALQIGCVPPAGVQHELRPVRITRGYTQHAEGSVLVEFGDTHVLCTASVEERVPPFLKDKGRGWVTAEYGMLPRATNTRSDREAARGKQSGRTQEIQRLIGRCAARGGRPRRARASARSRSTAT